MTKYCVKCGKALPDGVEICPDCGPDSGKKEAALFTLMTAETEVWKTAEQPEKKKLKIKLPALDGHTAIIGGCAAVAVVIAVLLIILTQPSARVTRAIQKGDIEKAYEIFWRSPSLSKGDRNEKVDGAIMNAAQDLCVKYSAHEIDADTAASLLSLLGGFGEGAADMLEDTYAEFRTFNGSQEHMLTADESFDAGDFLEAREEYLKVLDTDSDYSAAQERAAECLVRYGEKRGEEAENLMKENNYSEALKVLSDGNRTLYGYNTFSEAIDRITETCLSKYESYILEEAGKLAEAEEYDTAMDMIRTASEDFGTEVTSFEDALTEYAARATDKRVAEAGMRADTLYNEGAFEDAFAELDTFWAANPDNKPGARLLIEAMEQRYTEDVCEAAEVLYDRTRSNLPDVMELLDAALEIRNLDGIKACRDDLAQYLPLSLIEAEFTDKNKTVFRSSGEFESLDGTKFGGGWIWGEDGAEITFRVDGAYDEFYCAFADRRDDGANANGWFEVYADGEQVLKSEKLFHFQTDPQYHRIDISGCQELKLVFHCDYTVSTAEDGYCYHGLCDANLTKNIP